MQIDNFELEGNLPKIHGFAQIISDCLGLEIKTREEIVVILSANKEKQYISIGDLFNLIPNDNANSCKLIIKKDTSREIVNKFNLIIKFLTSNNDEKRAFLGVCLSDFLGNSDFLNYIITVLMENLTNVELLDIFNYEEGIPRWNSTKLKIILDNLEKQGKFDIGKIKIILDNLNHDLAIAERKVIKINQAKGVYSSICPHPENRIICSKLEIIEDVGSYEVRICGICGEKF